MLLDNVAVAFQCVVWLALDWDACSQLYHPVRWELFTVVSSRTPTYVLQSYPDSSQLRAQLCVGMQTVVNLIFWTVVVVEMLNHGLETVIEHLV